MPQQPRYGFQCEWFHPFSAAASWGGAVIRGYGATAVRLTPDQKVGSSNLSGLTFSLRGIFSRATQEFGLIFVLQEHQHFCSPWAYFMARSGHLPISIGTARTLENCGRKCLGNNMDQIIVPDIRLEWLCEWARTRKGSRDASTQFRGDPCRAWHMKHKVDTLGFEPRAFRMRSGCDTITPRAHLLKRSWACRAIGRALQR